VSGSVPWSLVFATEIDVLPSDRIVIRRDDCFVVRSPSNPAHYWGNLLIFDAPPAEGDAERWEQIFDREFGDEPGVRHKTFGWDLTDGSIGRAREEFMPRGYDLEETVGLVAEAGELGDHPRANRDVVVRALDPSPGADAALWQAVDDIQVAARRRADDAGPARHDRQRQGHERRARGAGNTYVSGFSDGNFETNIGNFDALLLKYGPGSSRRSATRARTWAELKGAGRAAVVALPARPAGSGVFVLTDQFDATLAAHDEAAAALKRALAR
jgi:hypothetical protein